MNTVHDAYVFTHHLNPTLEMKKKVCEFFASHGFFAHEINSFANETFITVEFNAVIIGARQCVWNVKDMIKGSAYDSRLTGAVDYCSTPTVLLRAMAVCLK